MKIFDQILYLSDPKNGHRRVLFFQAYAYVKHSSSKGPRWHLTFEVFTEGSCGTGELIYDKTTMANDEVQK